MTRFFDTNILVYAYCDDPRQPISKALMADVVSKSGFISVQILNELATVLVRKFRLPWAEIERALRNARDIFGPISPITETTHEAAIVLCRDHGLAIYDALVVVAALEAGCTELLSEDMQHGRKFGSLTIINPFLSIGKQE